MKNITQNSPRLSQEREERFGDEGGYFDVVVRPMLQKGHEGELCGWLKEMSLIRTVSNCPHDDCRGRSLVWHPARLVDKYHWACPHCSKKQSIREDSFFLSIKCDLKMCLQLILGWCQLIPADLTASNLNVKKHIVKKIYNRCDEVAEAYVSRHPEDWILGKQDGVVIIDEFPGGYMTESQFDITVTRKRNNNSHTIVCIAEANALPPKMWLHIVQTMQEPNKDENSNKNMAEEVLKEIMKHIEPGSYVVANCRTRWCNYESLCNLKQYKLISVEQLRKFDLPESNRLFENLETIWQFSIGACEAVQETTYALGQRIISTHLWRQRFGSSPSIAFQHMLNHIAESYRFT